MKGDSQEGLLHVAMASIGYPSRCCRLSYTQAMPSCHYETGKDESHQRQG